MKKVLFCSFALAIEPLAMEAGLCGDTFDDLRLQSKSNKPIIFIR